MFTVFESKELIELCDQIKKELKPNPHNWPIVKKWNYKYVWNKYKYRLFELIDAEISREIPKYIERTIGSLANTKEIE